LIFCVNVLLFVNYVAYLVSFIIIFFTFYGIEVYFSIFILYQMYSIVNFI